MPNKEGAFQTSFRKNLLTLFPNGIVCKLDSSYVQGIPDLLLLWEDRWAVFEVKRSANETKRPNQEYYVDLLNSLSFSAFVYPENEREVLDALQQAFGVHR